jgi:hypothetical protein
MHQETEDNTIEMLWGKCIVYSLLFLLVVIAFILAPKNVFDKKASYLLATSMAITKNDNLLLYDYQVYGNIERFEQGLLSDVQEVKLDFQERNEIVAIKIYGENNLIETREDYIFIIDSETPELNIEYYLVKDLEFNDIYIPCRTFIMLFTDISNLVNNIYFALYLVFFIILFPPISIKFLRNILLLLRGYKNKKRPI